MGTLLSAAQRMAGITKTNTRPSTKDAKPASSVFGRGNPNTAKTQPTAAKKE